MQEFWNQVFLDNTIRQYAIVLGIILLAYLLKRLVGKFVVSWGFKFVKNLGHDIDKKSFVDLIVGPVEDFLFVSISYFAIKTLTFPNALIFSLYKVGSPMIVESIGEFILIFYLFKMILRLVDYMAVVMEKKADVTPSMDDNQLIVFFKDFLKIVLTIVAILVVMKVIFMADLSKVLAGLSIVGAAIALAARESIENIIASFIIFFDKPFTVGDLLKVNNITGVVERIGLRSTRIRTVEKTYVTVPNKQMVDSIVDNLTLRTHRRGEIKVTVDAATSSIQLEKLIAGIKEMLKTHELIDFNVQFSEIVNDGFTVHFEYLSTTMDWKEFLLQKDRINLAMMRLLEELDIQLAGKHSIVGVVKR
jgi:MscS family membrane protein